MSDRTPINAVVWSLLERLSGQVVGFLIGVVLARLLSPSDYGTIGMMALFLALSNAFIEAGFGAALVRKQDRSEDDLTTAFYVNLCVGAIICVILCAMSGMIANFFREPVLQALVCIASVNLFLGAICIVQRSVLTAQLDIKGQTVISLIANIPSGLVAIFLAYRGYGVYALSIQSIVGTVVSSVAIWCYSGWRPRGHFSRSSLRYLWGFGSRLLAANLVGTFFNNVYSLIIGKFFPRESLGYYAKASSLTEHVAGTTTGIVMRSAVPILARYQADKVNLRSKFRECMSFMVMTTAPLSAALCFSGRDIIVFLWSQRWEDAVLLFQLLLVGAMFRPIGELSLAIFQVLGRTDITLKLELPKKCIYCLFIGVGLLYGVVGLAIAWIGVNVVASMINMYPTRKLLNYGYVGQFMDMLRYMIVAYSLSYVLRLPFAFNLPIVNIVSHLSCFFLAYVVALKILRDSCYLKYEGRIVNLIRSKFCKQV